MSVLTKKRSKPVPAPGKPSGEHPAVKTYRGKLQSISDGAGEQVKALDDELADYLKHVSESPPAPKE